MKGQQNYVQPPHSCCCAHAVKPAGYGGYLCLNAHDEGRRYEREAIMAWLRSLNARPGLDADAWPFRLVECLAGAIQAGDVAKFMAKNEQEEAVLTNPTPEDEVGK